MIMIEFINYRSFALNNQHPFDRHIKMNKNHKNNKTKYPRETSGQKSCAPKVCLICNYNKSNHSPVNLSFLPLCRKCRQSWSQLWKELIGDSDHQYLKILKDKNTSYENFDLTMELMDDFVKEIFQRMGIIFDGKKCRSNFEINKQSPDSSSVSDSSRCCNHCRLIIFFKCKICLPKTSLCTSILPCSEKKPSQKRKIDGQEGLTNKVLPLEGRVGENLQERLFEKYRDYDFPCLKHLEEIVPELAFNRENLEALDFCLLKEYGKDTDVAVAINAITPTAHLLENQNTHKFPSQLKRPKIPEYYHLSSNLSKNLSFNFINDYRFTTNAEKSIFSILYYYSTIFDFWATNLRDQSIVSLDVTPPNILMPQPKDRQMILSVIDPDPNFNYSHNPLHSVGARFHAHNNFDSTIRQHTKTYSDLFIEKLVKNINYKYDYYQINNRPLQKIIPLHINNDLQSDTFSWYSKLCLNTILDDACGSLVHSSHLGYVFMKLVSFIFNHQKPGLFLANSNNISFTIFVYTEEIKRVLYSIRKEVTSSLDSKKVKLSKLIDKIDEIDWRIFELASFNNVVFYSWLLLNRFDKSTKEFKASPGHYFCLDNIATQLIFQYGSEKGNAIIDSLYHVTNLIEKIPNSSFRMVLEVSILLQIRHGFFLRMSAVVTEFLIYLKYNVDEKDFPTKLTVIQNIALIVKNYQNIASDFANYLRVCDSLLKTLNVLELKWKILEFLKTAYKCQIFRLSKNTMTHKSLQSLISYYGKL